MRRATIKKRGSWSKGRVINFAIAAGVGVRLPRPQRRIKKINPPFSTLLDSLERKR